jgi:hypothetical protein
VDDPVKDGIGEGLLTNDFMPIGYGPLRRNNGGSLVVTIFDNLHQGRFVALD